MTATAVASHTYTSDSRVNLMLMQLAFTFYRRYIDHKIASARVKMRPRHSHRNRSHARVEAHHRSTASIDMPTSNERSACVG
ncbi:protein of unknown function (plasmid) [Caballeronia sp. S22]